MKKCLRCGTTKKVRVNYYCDECADRINEGALTRSRLTKEELEKCIEEAKPFAFLFPEHVLPTWWRRN